MLAIESIGYVNLQCLALKTGVLKVFATVTGAYSKIGINAKDGVIYFLQRKSPDKAAQDLWHVVEPVDAELPKLRASSDIAWGL
jgi:hypothetical protein